MTVARQLQPDGRDPEALMSENQRLKETLAWVAKNSLDAATRRRARDTLTQVGVPPDPAGDDWRADPELDGEWCI